MPRHLRAHLRLAVLAAASLFTSANLTAAPLQYNNAAAGSWNTDSLTWSGASGLVPWQNTTTAEAGFSASATPGTVHLDAPIVANALVFNADGYTIAPRTGTLTLAGSTPTITVNTDFATISAPILGTQGLTTAGTGTLVLSGQSTYSGGTNVTAGSLQLAVDNALPNDSLTLTGASTVAFAGVNQSLTDLTLNDESLLTITANLDSNFQPIPGKGSLTVTSLSGIGDITLAQGGILTVNIAKNAASTFSGKFNFFASSYAGSLVKEGEGTLNLTSTASLTGAFSSPAIAVEAGTLVGNTANLNDTIFVDQNATLIFSESTEAFFIGTLSGSGHIIIQPAGSTPVTLTLFSPNTHTGDTTIATNATLAVTADNQLGTLLTGSGLNLAFTYATLIFQGGTLLTNAPITSARPLQITAAGGTLNTGTASSTFSGPISELTTFTSQGVTIPGTGPLTLAGIGSVAFSTAASSFDSLIINQPAVTLNNAKFSLVHFGPSDTVLDLRAGSLLLQNAASLTSTGTTSIGSLAPATITLDGQGTSFQTNATTVGFLGNASLTVQNAATASTGNLTLGNVSDLTATLNVTSAATVNSTSAAMATALLTQNLAAIANVTGQNSQWNLSANLTMSTNSILSQNVSATLSISNAAAVTVAGTTTLRDNAAITVNAATFATGALASPGNTNSTITLTDGATPALILGSDLAPNNSYFGLISGAGSITKLGANTQTLTANNTYTGATTVNAGTLILAGNSASSAFTANNTAALTFSDTTLNLAFNSITANTGATVNYTNNTAITGGFLFGPGTHNFTAGSLTGTQIFNGANLNITNASFKAVTSAANITVSTLGSLTWNGGSNAGALNTTNSAFVNLANFTSSGTINVGSAATINVTSADLILSGGSRTTLVGGAGPILNGHPTILVPGTINLTANNAIQLNGGLLTNNGVITGPTYVNFGGLAKGSGTYGQVFLTDGGKFSPGNSPGNATTADASWASAGAYEWQLADAAGAPGTGFDHWTINGALAITAGKTANSRFLIQIESLDAADNPDLAANFNPTQSYSWQILSASEGITGFDPTDFTLDTANFQNTLAGGAFSLTQSANSLTLNFTPAPLPVPEPASLALLALPLPLLRKKKTPRPQN